MVLLDLFHYCYCFSVLFFLLANPTEACRKYRSFLQVLSLYELFRLPIVWDIAWLAVCGNSVGDLDAKEG